MSVAETQEGELSQDLRFRDLLNALPSAVYTTDAEGRITFFNRAAEELAGRTPKLGEDRWCVSWKLYDADGAPMAPEECPMATALKEGRPVRDVPLIAERPDGERIPLMPFPTPIHDANGALVGAVNMLVDISALKRAEAALARRAEEQGVLYRFTDRLQRAESEEQVFAAALDAILVGLACTRAAVLLFDRAGIMRFVGARGLSEAYCNAVEGHSPWHVNDADPAPVCIDDVERTDVLNDALKHAVRTEGIGALAFIPIVVDGAVIGKFMAYHDTAHAFDAQEIDLAHNIARQLAFRIQRQRAEDAARHAEQRQRRSDMEFRLLADNIHQLAWMTDASGWIYWYNQRWFDYTGTTLEEMQGWGWQAVHAPDHVERVTEKFRACIAAGEPWEDTFPLRGRDGSYRWFLSRALPIRDDSGAIVRWFGTNTDVTDRFRAEEVQQRLTSIIENSEDAIVSKNLQGVIVSWNKGAERVFGYTQDEAIGKPITMLMPPEHVNEEPGILERIRRNERIEHYETVRVRKDGVRIFISLTVSPVKDSHGRVVGASKIARDVTERKRAEAQRTLLVNELNHRVKNTLATVQSLALQTMRGADNIEAAHKLFQARLGALSRAHDLLTRQHWQGAAMEEVVERALAPFRSSDDRFVIGGPEAYLSPKQALALSIALHELATNASKYGALSGETGRIAVAWSLTPQGFLHLEWRESDGPPVAKPTRTGFGSRLIERNLAAELGGDASIEYRPEGVVARLSMQLAANAGAPL